MSGLLVVAGSTAPAAADVEIVVDGVDGPVVGGDYSLHDLLPDSLLFHPDVMDQIDPDSPLVVELRDELTDAQRNRDDAAVRRLGALGRIGLLGEHRREQLLVIADLRTVDDAADEEMTRRRSELQAYAIDTYANGEERDLTRLRLDGAMSPVPGLADAAAEVVTERHAEAVTDRAAARQALLDAERHHRDLGDRLDAAERDLAAAEVDLEDAGERIDDLRPRLEQALVDESVPGTDLTLIVIDAYFRASVRMAERRPTCGVSWDQLAGVGLIESRHGRFGGSEVGPGGRTTDEILGPVLDGDPFAAIPDTDGGLLDGDTVWDRAVGPMQFIPSSWAIYGLDGNDDDELDPHNLYDAALAAAEHLCRGHSALQVDANYQRSLLGYNRSVQYGLDVMAARERYRSAVTLVPTSQGLALDAERRAARTP